MNIIRSFDISQLKKSIISFNVCMEISYCIFVLSDKLCFIEYNQISVEKNTWTILSKLLVKCTLFPDFPGLSRIYQKPPIVWYNITSSPDKARRNISESTNRPRLSGAKFSRDVEYYLLPSSVLSICHVDFYVSGQTERISLPKCSHMLRLCNRQFGSHRSRKVGNILHKIYKSLQIFSIFFQFYIKFKKS